MPWITTNFHLLIGWFKQHVNLYRFILCLKVRESLSFYVHIHIFFFIYFFFCSFFIWRMGLTSQHILSPAIRAKKKKGVWEKTKGPFVSASPLAGTKNWDETFCKLSVHWKLHTLKSDIKMIKWINDNPKVRFRVRIIPLLGMLTAYSNPPFLY